MAAYDVIVVGAGSAGGVLASRLSEDPTQSVLLLEAGPDHTAANAPAGVQSANFLNALGEPGRIWPELVATRTPGQEPRVYLRGRGAGGSSSVNALCALRGTVDDYDRWVHAYGCTGWGWDDMLEQFLRIEDDVDYGGDGLHGQGGPLPLSRISLDALSPLDIALREAIVGLGYGESDDYHARDATGLSRAALTIRAGKRVSTNDAYVEPARSRVNFEVRGNALVDRVLFDRRRAVGVRTTSGEEIAGREVVVSAGAIHSPALLLRSGIDDLPVGANLKEHAATAGFEIGLKPSARMSSPEASVFGSVLRYSSELADAGPNDMQMLWFGAVGPTDNGLAGGRLVGAAMRVFSHGRVSLQSADATIDPRIEFNMLSDDRDRVRLRDCVRRMVDVVRHPAIDAISESVVALTTPLADLQSDDEVDAWLTANVNDYVHAVGTCAMGAVVDTECRVIGYEQLRVCDASVMPDLPKANTNLTTLAIAERIAEKMRDASGS